MNFKKILVVFKTHLDIGFTDFAGNVIKQYEDVFIPSAVKTADELRKKGSDAGFKWTTGSWLIYEALEKLEGEALETLVRACERGDICWHALPFTTHTELMNRELFEYGLSLSRKLDERFGRKTIAAKMTDVPGHTKQMIPLMKKAGIEFLHLGVNPASAVPDVPEIFRWVNGEDEITVIYNGVYGNMTALGDTGVALYFAHTDDNIGAQTAEQVEEIFAQLKADYPGAEITAADLNDAALVLRDVRETLPVVTDEIGDSWIHGVASDPRRVADFRGMLRFAERDEKTKEILYPGLVMIPEHTWGLDVKTHLHDWYNYSPKDLAANRMKDNFLKMEASRDEQRNFILDAAARLPEGKRRVAEKVMQEYRREKACTEGMNRINPGVNAELNGYLFNFNKKGAVSYLCRNGRVIADEDNVLFEPLYEAYCFDDFVTFHKRYHRIEEPWAWEDFTKIGMNYMTDARRAFRPSAEIYTGEEKIVIKYFFDEEASVRFGCPAFADMIITPDGEGLTFDFAWFEKQANRGAESFWLKFRPIDKNLKISKLGVLTDPKKVVSRGNRGLHATDRGISFDGLTVECLDSALVAPCYPCILDYPDELPCDDGAYFGLYNNIWATNFNMWYDEDARFRFNMQLKNT